MLPQVASRRSSRHPRALPRVTFIGRYTKPNGIVRSMATGLVELGCPVQELNVAQRTELLSNPFRRYGGHGPVFVDLGPLREDISAHRPDVILMVAGGLVFAPDDMTEAKARCPVVGVTLSDPDVFPTVSEYSREFAWHTTNSLLALKRYRQRGDTNVVLLPFAVDAQYFVPRKPQERFRADVAIIGHAWPERLPVAERLVRRFDAKLYGRNWPWNSPGQVYGEEWFQAAYSAKLMVNLPRTRAQYVNVKVGVFEAAATGRLLLTERFDEMEEYFRYGREIVDYRDADDLVEKVTHYLDHPDEAKAIATAGRIRCGLEHTWSRRFSRLFGDLGIEAGSGVW